MRAYLALLSARGTPLPDVATLTRHARAALPFIAAAPGATWIGAGVALHAWHNEPDQADRPLLAQRGERAAGFSGYGRLDATGTLDEDGPGVWATFAAEPGRLRAATSASGTEMVFVAETDDLVVVGNRASLVHAVARGGVVELDPVGLAAVVNAGFLTTARTPLAGVTSLDPATELVASAAGVTVRALPDTTRGESGPASVDEVARALLDSVAGLAGPATVAPVRLGLTGGRDSRLLAALLARAGVAVTTRTAGLPDDPDVVVAREVAERLGIPHVVQRPAGTRRSADRTALVVDPRERVREAVALGEGMLSAYDRVGRLGASYDADVVPFSGSGGEILRGYYATALDGVELGEVGRRVLKRRAHPRERLLHPGVRAAYLDDLAGWRRWVGEEPAAALEAFYVRQRTGRWSGAARGSSSTGSLAWRPFFDHGVVRTVRRTPLAARTSERLFADLLSALAPELDDVRFAGKRWKFDTKAPTDPAALAAWEARAPLVGSSGGRSSFEWRTDAPEVRAELRAMVAEAPPSLWSVLDETAVDKLLGQEAPSRADVVTAWHLATVAVALGTDGGIAIDQHGPAGASTAIEVDPVRPEAPAPAATPWRDRGRGLARTLLRGASRIRR